MAIGGVAVWVGDVASIGEDSRRLAAVKAWRLDRRASSRLIILELERASGSCVEARRDLGSSEVALFRCSVPLASLLPGRTFVLEGLASALSSASAIHSSVRLLHILSAFRRSCRSTVLAGPMADAGLSIPVARPPVLPAIAAKVSASIAVASRTRYMLVPSKGFDLAKAECRSGCILSTPRPLTVDASGETVLSRLCFGDDDTVVTVVVAVRGRSPKTLAIAAPEDGGIFPVSSSLRILDFMSSSSSHTVEGAVVDTVDSVPSAWGVWSAEFCSTIGEERPL